MLKKKVPLVWCPWEKDSRKCKSFIHVQNFRTLVCFSECKNPQILESFWCRPIALVGCCALFLTKGIHPCRFDLNRNNLGGNQIVGGTVRKPVSCRSMDCMSLRIPVNVGLHCAFSVEARRVWVPSTPTPSWIPCCSAWVWYCAPWACQIQ